MDTGTTGWMKGTDIILFRDSSPRQPETSGIGLCMTRNTKLLRPYI